MSGILNNPEVRSSIDRFMAEVVPASWSAKRKGMARDWLERLIVTACDVGAAGARVADDRMAAAEAFQLALGLAQTMEPEVAIKASPDNPAAAMKAMIVSHLAQLAGREAA